MRILLSRVLIRILLIGILLIWVLLIRVLLIGILLRLALPVVRVHRRLRSRRLGSGVLRSGVGGLGRRIAGFAPFAIRRRSLLLWIIGRRRPGGLFLR